MTILVNELHFGNGITDATLVQVADRRITINGRYHSTRRKIFEIPYLKASVGYFGLAQTNKNNFFSSLVPNIIRNGASIQTISDFAEYFMAELNRLVTKQLLIKYASGFHLCGLATDGVPEFYFIRNFDQMNGPFYHGFRDHYYMSEDFRNRDAIIGENGTIRPLTEINNATFFYVNGDLRSFRFFWDSAGLFVNQISSDQSFMRPSTLSELAKWKLEALSSFYRAFSKQQIVGKPIDAIEIRP